MKRSLLFFVLVLGFGKSLGMADEARRNPILKWEAESPEPIPTPEKKSVKNEPPPPHIRQSIPTRPEPNELTVIDVNPPTFRWMGDWSRPYTLHIRREGQTWEQGAQAAGIAETFHRPLKPLAPGKWEWRVRREGGEWMGPFSFVISPETAQWPIPAWEEIFARFSRHHPRIMVSAVDLDALREKAKGAMKEFTAKWLRSLESQVDKDLALEQDKRRVNTKDLHARTIQRTSSKKDAGHLIGSAGQMAFLGLVLDRDDLRQEAIRRTMAATRLDPRGYTSHEVSDFSNGAIVKNAGEVYDYLYDRLTPGQRKAIRDTIHARLFQYKPKLEQSVFNAHGWQHVIGDLTVGAMAIWDEDPEAFEWLKWVTKMFVAFYPWYGGAEGGSAEGAGYYAGTDLNPSLEFRELWKRAVGIDFAAKPWFHNTAYFLIYGHPPGQPVSQFCDHAPLLAPPSESKGVAALVMADTYDNPYAAAYAQAILAGAGLASWQNVNWGRLAPTGLIEGPFGRLKPRPLGEMPHGRVFHDVGVAYVHNAIDDPQRNVMFEFRSSPYGSFNHAHADQNSFNITAFGEPLIIDSGYYSSYGDEHHYGWTVQTKAHNTILVDGQGQPSRNIDAYGRIVGFDQGADWAWMAGEASTAYRQPALSRFLRQAVWLGGEQVQTYVIFDSLAAKDEKPHRYAWLLHTATEPKIDAETRRMVVRGEKALGHVTWMAPAMLKFSLTDKFDPPAINWRPDKQKQKYKDQWHLTALPTLGAAAQTFLTVIQVCRADAKAPFAEPAAEGDAAVRIGKDVLRFSEEGVRIEREGKAFFHGMSSK